MASNKSPRIAGIRQTRAYTLSEVADLLNTHVNTVRRWIKAGLPLIDELRPQMVHGSELHAFLMKRRLAKRQRCQPDQLYCCACRQPRIPRKGSVTIVQQGINTLIIKARCSVCETVMHRAGSVPQADEYKRVFGIPKRSIMTGETSLREQGNIPVNDDLLGEDQT